MQKTKTISIIVTIFLGSLTVSGFILQVTTYKKGVTSAHEIALFNLIQFILTIGFSYLSAKLISENEYFLRLKSVAISAFRRIDDMEKIIRRLKNKLNTKKETSMELSNEIILEIVEDLNLLTISSKSDWSDIIGEEIKIIEKIRKLEEEKKELESLNYLNDNQFKIKIDELESQIKALDNNIPAKLSSSQSQNNELEIKYAAQWLKEEHFKTSGLILVCISGSEYGNLELVERLNNKDKLAIYVSEGRGMSVLNNENEIVGRVTNNSPLGYTDFKRAFFKCYRSRYIGAEFQKISTKSAGLNHNLTEFTIKVIDEPNIE